MDMFSLESLVKIGEGNGGDFNLIFRNDLVDVVFFYVVHTTYLAMDHDNQKKLLRGKKNFLPEITVMGLLLIIGQTFVSFVAWVVFDLGWNRIKGWFQKKKK